MKRNAHIGMFTKIATIAFLLIGYVSCTEEDVVSKSNPNKKSDVVTFGVSLTNKWEADRIEGAKSANGQSRTSSSPMEYEGDEWSEQIYMYMVEEDCPPVIDTLKVDSRTSGSEEQTFGIFAYQYKYNVTEDVYTFDKVFAEMQNMNLSNYGVGNYQYWPGGEYGLQFIAYSPYTNATEGNYTIAYNENNEPVMKFTVSDKADYPIWDNKTNIIKADGTTSEVKLELNHVLSKIQVKAGDLGDNAKITSIQINGIYTSGERNLATGEWTIPEENTTNEYTQLYEEGKPWYDEENGTYGEPLYLIPGSASADATITIGISVTSEDPKGGERKEEYTLTKKLGDLANWTGNKQYTYVISTPEEVKVEVSDEVKWDDVQNRCVKENLTITNTGLSPAYIRASLIGYWVVTSEGKDYIVADWKPEDDGDFVWGNNNGNAEPETDTTTGWRKHGAYYYHMDAVPAKGTTAQLFEKYILGNTAPVADAELHLTIAVQAVYENDVHEVWPEAITKDIPKK